MSNLNMFGGVVPPTPTTNFAGGENRNVLVQENFREIELQEQEDFEIICKTAAAFVVCQD